MLPRESALLLAVWMLIATPVRLMWAVRLLDGGQGPDLSMVNPVLFQLAAFALVANMPLIAVRLATDGRDEGRMLRIRVPAIWSVIAATLLAGLGLLLG